MTQESPQTPSLEIWRSLLADPERHWRAGYSAMATAQSWTVAKGLPEEIAALLGSDAGLLGAPIPEHKVRLDGFGRESQCDVFAQVRVGGRTGAVAVEGKVNETFGPTLDEWLAKGSRNRRKRLDGLCQKLGLQLPLAGSLRYQLFHRTAAAVIEADRLKTDFAAMIVQSFSPDLRWFDDFAAFARLFGQEPQPGKAVEVALTSGRTLLLGWAKGDARFLSDLSLAA